MMIDAATMTASKCSTARPGGTATFSGALRYPRYGPVTRWIMKLISRRSGGPTDTSQEYEFTDWQAVDRFGEDLARALADEVQGIPRRDA